MTINNNDYKQDVRYASEFVSGITKNLVQQTFAGSKNLSAMLSIFDKLNARDKWKKMDDTPEDELSDMAARFLPSRVDNSKDGYVNDFELDYFLQCYGKEFEGITKEDIREFLDFMNMEGIKQRAKSEEKENLKNANTAKKLGIPKEVVDKIAKDDYVDQYRIVNYNGKKVLRREAGDNYRIRDLQGNVIEESGSEYCNVDAGFGDLASNNNGNFSSVTKYDSKGNIISETYTNEETSEKIRYENNTEFRLKDGVGVKRRLDKNNKPYIDEIVFDTDEKVKTKLNLKYDENGNLTGININDESKSNAEPDKEMRGFQTDGMIYITHMPELPQQTRLGAESFSMIKDLLDKGAKYGQDFELAIENGEIKVKPKIKNNTDKQVPDLKGDALEKYKHLATNDAHADEDFDVIYDEDGNFTFDYKNNQAKEYSVDYKTEKYDKNGNKIYSLTVDNGLVTEEKIVNGKLEKSEMPLDDKLMEMLLAKDFAGASKLINYGADGGENPCYALAEKYEKITGHNLVADAFASGQEGAKTLVNRLGAYDAKTPDEAVKLYNQAKEVNEKRKGFDINKSQIAYLIQKSERHNIDSSHFTENINGLNFDVKINKNTITVSLNGKSFNINASGVSQKFVENVLSKINAQILYDMAISKIQIKTDDKLDYTTNGFYNNRSNTIFINPNSTINGEMIRVISHESGHMVDCIEDRDNAIAFAKVQLRDALINEGRDKPVTVQEILESNGLNVSVSDSDETLNQCYNEEKRNYYKIKDKCGDLYALGNIHEFFAEAYCLITTGRCRNNYLMATYFPKSVARVKEIIEQNRNFKIAH